MLRGAYQFFRPDQDPIAQADFLLDEILPVTPGDLPPVLDLENAGDLTHEQVVASVQAWIDHVSAAIGRPPIVYAGLYSWPELTGGADYHDLAAVDRAVHERRLPQHPRPVDDVAVLAAHRERLGARRHRHHARPRRVRRHARRPHRVRERGAAPPCGTIAADGGEIDDGDPCFVGGGPATTLRHVTEGESGDLVWTHATASAEEANYAQWDLTLERAGDYDVEAYTDHAYATSTQATYQVRAAGATTAVTIDQSAADGWQRLGTFTFAAGGGQFIHLGDATGEAGDPQLVFDAIRLVPVDDGSFEGEPVMVATDGGGCSAGGLPGWWLVLLVVPLNRRRPRCVQ